MALFPCFCVSFGQNGEKALVCFNKRKKTRLNPIALLTNGCSKSFPLGIKSWHHKEEKKAWIT